MEQTLGKRIVTHRKRLGLTQDQLAERLGVTAQAVSKWENDQSCPDISTIPLLADIFGISTDALLGRQTRQETLHQAEVIPAYDSQNDQSPKNSWEFTYDAGRHGAVGAAVLVLGIGLLMLLARFLHRDVSFWSLLWPWGLTVFGLFGFIKKPSFFPIGCLLFGVYFLLDHLALLPFTLGGEMILPAILILLGLGLLADALRKPRKSKFHVRHNGNTVASANSLEIDGETFCYSASFGESSQVVEMPLLREGSITTSFGEYTVNLSGVEALAQPCELAVNCSFGELTLLVPRQFRVRSTNTASFAEVQVCDQPDSETAGTIDIDAHASFGEITIRYI